MLKVIYLQFSSTVVSASVITVSGVFVTCNVTSARSMLRFESQTG